GLGLARPSWQTPTLERSLQLGATVIRLLIGSYLIAILVTELITESNMVVPWLVKGGFVLLVLTGVFLVMALISGIPHWLFGYLSSLPHVMEWGCAGFILLLAGIGLMAVGLGGSRHMLIVQLALIMITVSVLWLLPPIPTAIKLVVVLALWLELSVALIWQYVDLVEGTTTLNRIMTLIILLPILAAWYWSWLRQSAFALHNPADFSPRTTAISYELFHLQRLEAGILNRSMMILTLLLIAIGHDYPLADYLWPLVLLDSLFWAFTWLVLPLTRAALSRRVLIQDLADNLTLMTSVIENQGVDQALEVVAKVTQRRTLFGREFARVLYEIQLGKTREDAYRDLAIRHNFPALHTVVALFNQQHQELRQQVGILDELTQRMQRQASAQDARLAAEFAPSLLLVVSLAIIPALTLWLTGIGLI
ncbi:MAG: type II secretion system F family protein, partial [Anaerolineae bacterium]|nr:type II secretion system F family protein [Anaerolineae bacterium]